MKTEMKAKIFQYIDKNRDKLIETVQKLVQIPTVTGNEGPGQDYMAKLYNDIGLAVDCFTPEIDIVKKHPTFVEPDLSFAGRPNVVGVYEGTGAGRSLILNGHIDVVSPEPVCMWQYEPWAATIVGDRIYGRGTADMKAGLISNYFALKMLLDLGIKPQGKVILESVVGEESGSGGGTLACFMKDYKADGMIASEPHNLNVNIAHVGILYFRVKVMGKAAHGGLAHLGINAIGKMYPIYLALEELGNKRGQEIQHDLYMRGSGRTVHLSIGTIQAGDWPAKVAGSATLQGRISFVNGETEEAIKELICTTVNKAVENDPWFKEHPPLVEWFGWHNEPWYQDPEASFVKSFISSAEKTMGRPVELIGRASGNDARFGPHFNTPSICCGPKGGEIHGYDEYVEIPSVFEYTKALAIFICEWCGINE